MTLAVLAILVVEPMGNYRTSIKQFLTNLKVKHMKFVGTVAEARRENPELDKHLRKAMEDLNPLRVLNLFKMISPTDCELLGLDPATPRADHAVDLPPGATVVLYTDGLVERRTEELDVGLERLRAAGAEVLQEPIDQPYGVRDCAFRDPAGNHLRFSQAL